MRYLDSGHAIPEQALAAWIEAQVNEPIDRLRLQSGYFSRDGLTHVLPILEDLSLRDMPVAVLLGSNDGITVREHVSYLVQAMRLPRENGRLGIVSFSGALFHPKTYHVTRGDGSQAAYVGSSNLGHASLTGLNVEAGLLLDTREGDPAEILDQIGDAIEAWFIHARSGLEVVNNPEDVFLLESQGVLATAPEPRPPGSGVEASPRRPRRTPLFTSKKTSQSVDGLSKGAIASSAFYPTPRDDYPSYVLFAPGKVTPSVGREALSGSLLPNGARGVVFRLSKDSVRKWHGGSGTANISIPVPLISTLAFGLYSRDPASNRKRPRAEFQQRVRYVSLENTITSEARSAGIMLYGHTEGDKGHGDMRLVVSEPLVIGLKEQVTKFGLHLPKGSDPAILEWPTERDPMMRLSLLDPSTNLFGDCVNLIDDAERNGRIIGKAACWLPPGMSPAWEA